MQAVGWATRMTADAAEADPGFPDDYLAMLELLGRVFDGYRNATGFEAVLVGGAATALSVGWAFATSDFDVVAAADDEFASAMLERGFRPEDDPRHLQIGFYHPDHPSFGVQQVSGRLFDGRSDPRRLRRFVITAHESTVVLPSIEDLIADRLGQHAIASPTDDSRLRQARALFRLAENPDLGYLTQRFRDEGGDPTLLE